VAASADKHADLSTIPPTFVLALVQFCTLISVVSKQNQYREIAGIRRKSASFSCLVLSAT